MHPSTVLPMEEEALAEKLGALVRRLRLERGYSQAEFAEVCRLERAYMGMIERSEVNISVRIALKIAKGLSLTLSGLFAKLEHSPERSQGGHEVCWQTVRTPKSSLWTMFLAIGAPSKGHDHLFSSLPP
jgi:transcriptional regulator with XRE-family HTH domain